MKRTSLKRKTPLKARKSLALKRYKVADNGFNGLSGITTSQKENKPKITQTVKNKDYCISAELKYNLIIRAGACCEKCHKPADWRGLQAHHKEFRSHGGKDTLDNLILVCGKCHAEYHGIKEI